MQKFVTVPPCKVPCPPAPPKQPQIYKVNNKKEIDKRVRLLTKEMFILEWTIRNRRASKERLNNIWERISMGYNFVVQTEDGNTYSIPYLNSMIDTVGEDNVIKEDM